MVLTLSFQWYLCLQFFDATFKFEFEITTPCSIFARHLYDKSWRIHVFLTCKHQRTNRSKCIPEAHFCGVNLVRISVRDQVQYMSHTCMIGTMCSYSYSYYLIVTLMHTYCHLFYWQLRDWPPLCNCIILIETDSQSVLIICKMHYFLCDVILVFTKLLFDQLWVKFKHK